LTVTAGFDESGFDERRFANTVAKQLGTEHHEHLVAASQTASADLIDKLAWHFDEPFADASAIPTYLISQAARRHVTVALSGDGGDEVLAGYRRYRFDRHEEMARQLLPSALRRGLIGPLATIYPQRAWMPRWLRAGATLRNIATDAASAHALSVATMNPALARTCLNHDVANSLKDYDPLEQAREYYERCDAPDHLSKCQYVDIKLGLADGILTKVDRASMAHALEVRSPMLDHRFVEFAWRIPPSQRIRGNAGKYPLRMAVSKRLGEETAFRSKQGFEVPLDAWFRGPLREFVEDTLLAPSSAISSFVNADAIRRTWDDHRSGRRNLGPTLWKFAMLAAWARHFAHATDFKVRAQNALEAPACIR
jgi:asparagine synthase (glutamine-hydrolysing)